MVVFGGVGHIHITATTLTAAATATTPTAITAIGGAGTVVGAMAAMAVTAGAVVLMAGTVAVMASVTEAGGDWRIDRRHSDEVSSGIQVASCAVVALIHADGEYAPHNSYYCCPDSERRGRSRLGRARRVVGRFC